MAKPIFSKVTNGELSDSAEVELRAELATHEGKDICIKIERKRKKRTLNQNSFMHGPFFDAMQEMFRDFGNEYDLDLVKSIFKHQFGVKTVVELPGGNKEIVEKSTADYTTIECENAMDKARMYYLEFYKLPYPHQLGYDIQG